MRSIDLFLRVNPAGTTPPPPASGGSKIMVQQFYTYCDPEDALAAFPASGLRPAVDGIRFRAHGQDGTWNIFIVSALQQYQAAFKEITFTRFDLIQSRISAVLQAGVFDTIDWNVEPGDVNTEPEYVEDNVAAAIAGSTIAHENGLKFSMTPVQAKIVDQGAEFAPYLDYLNIQMQSDQFEPDVFSEWLDDHLPPVMEANPDLKVILQQNTVQPPAPGLSLLESWQTNVQANIGRVAGATIWYECPEMAVAKQFADWFTQAQNF